MGASLPNTISLAQVTGKEVIEESKTSDPSVLVALPAKLQIFRDCLNGSKGRAWARWP